jgi:hypothetical protein
MLKLVNRHHKERPTTHFWTDFLSFALVDAVSGGRYYSGLNLSPFHTF